MAKPAGPACNLACSYCFYRAKEDLFTGSTMMSDDILERYVAEYIASQPGPEVHFTWQGGEPLLAGIDFYRHAVALQARHAGGRTIRNAIQTNGVALDEPWAAFFAEQDFLVGLSIDGPEAIHDRFRVDRGGRPTFAAVMAAAALLRAHDVPFNTLSVIHHNNADNPVTLYRFLRDEVGSRHIQLIPIVEREKAGDLVAPHDCGEARLTRWSVRPEPFGRLLIAIFDEWVRHDVGRVFLQLFESWLAAWAGSMPSLCFFQPTCGDAMVIEHDGSVFACDHYVYPEYELGRLGETPLAEIASSEDRRRFGDAKRNTLPDTCGRCEFLFACHGGCPKHRLPGSESREPGLNYLCRGYRAFFNHAGPALTFMADQLRQRQSPATVMQWVRANRAAVRRKPGRNEPCSCGSGKKYKRCCGSPRRAP